MALSRRTIKSALPFHISGRCPNREPFGLNLDTVWTVMEDYLYLVNKKYELCIHSFVLMPNHFHLIASSHKHSLGKPMQDFMGLTSKELNRLSGKINQTWGSRYFKCELNKTNYFYNAYKYIYQNPLRANLVDRVEDWKFSTLSGKLGKSKLIVPVEEDTVLFNPDFKVEKLEWLNTRIEKANYESIKTALQKTVFKLPKLNQKTNPLENFLS